MSPWMVWLLMALVFGVLWLGVDQANSCRDGQIFIPRGFGGACVAGSWR